MFEFSVSVQVDVPLHAPDQPANVDPAAGMAVRVTELPVAKFAEHVCPQSIPAGLLVTVPDPVPEFVTVSCAGGAVAVLNPADTKVLPAMVTLHAPVPLQAPPQPVNVMPDAAVAVRVKAVPAEKVAEQVCPQLMPAGELVMVPLPVG